MRSACMLALMILLLPATVHGSAARLLALGGDGSYLEDNRGVLRWYGSVVDHAGYAQIESGLFDQDGYLRLHGHRLTGPALGGVVALGGDTPRTALGAWLATRGAATDPGSMALDLLETTGTLLAGHVLGRVALGASWRHGTAGETWPDAWSRVTDLTRDDLGLGARIDLGPEAYLDVAGEWRRVTATTTVNDDPTSYTRTATGSYGVRTRLFMALSDQLVLTPLVEYIRDERDWASDEQPAGVDGTAWRMGCGLTWLPDPDQMVVFSAEHRGAETRGSLDTGSTHVGGELDTTAWILRAAAELRAGAFWSLRTSLGVEGTSIQARPENLVETIVPVAVGLALHAGHWDLDLGLSSHAPAGTAGFRADLEGSTWMNATLSATF